MKTRQVLGPEVIQHRMATAQEENVWYFIKKVNEQLLKNPINLDGSIDVLTYYHVDEDFINRLIDVYKGVGWTNITYRFTDNDVDNNKMGQTIVNFKP